MIQASKTATINSLRDLAPVLDGFAKAGQNFPRSFQVFLTYPFVDEAVGRDPQVARNLHMGDYTNLSVNLDLNLTTLTLPEVPPITLLPQICAAVKQARAEAQRLAKTLPGNTQAQRDIRDRVLKAMLADIGTNCSITVNDVRIYFANLVAGLGATLAGAVCPAAGPAVCGLLTNPTFAPTVTLPANPLANGAGAGLGGVGLPRAQLGPGYQAPAQIDPFGLAKHGLDPGVGTLLFQGVATQR